MHLDSQNFEKLYEKYFERFLAFILYRVKSREDAEDLNSILWERILKNLESLQDGTAQFEAWSFKTARNLVIDFYRANDKRKGQVDLEEAFSVKDNLDLEGDLKNESDLQQLFDLVEKLPDAQREVFKLRYFDGFQNKEIAKLLDINEKTVASNLVRAKKYLEEIFLKCSNYLSMLVLIAVILNK